MKKATSKRERKYGKKDSEEGTQVVSPPRGKKVKVMVDGYQILEFKSLGEANEYINRKTKQAIKSRREPASFIFL